MSIIALVMSILLPAINTVRSTAKTLQCSSNMRSIALEFTMFADGTSADGRGDSESLRGGRFRIGDFQESLYGIDEFWDSPSSNVGSLSAGQSLMCCPSGAPKLAKRKGFPCSTQSLGPGSDVSLAINMRLHRSVVEFRRRRVLAPATSAFLTPRVLSHPYVPLVMDVDGAEAGAKGVEPFYMAPPSENPQDPYASGRYWMPSKRHRGIVNVAFTGGHVLRSKTPDKERWDWGYQAEVGR